jgi:hypothetical protein
MEFKVGDKVRVKKNLKDIAGFSHGYMPDMESFEGKIVTIRSVYAEEWVTIEEDTHRYSWDFRAFEPINNKPTKEELLQMPIGTRITTNRDADNIFVKISDDAFENNYDECVWDTDIEEDLSITDIEYGDKIIKIEVPTYETVYDSSKEVKEMTVDEICKALGYNVKIIKEEI